ncbi:MAG: SDR family oxidoreductase, partial [Acidobacteria bacterium]|nr:SDR family oxidoreductase [Acidobacteriota bacterium]
SGPADRYDAPPYDYRGKVALVTGASQGVGRHAAFGLARCGASVVLAGRSDEGQETVDMIASDRQARDAGGGALFVRTDVTQETEIEAVIEEAVSRYGALHFAINNAGHNGVNTLTEDQTAANYDAVFAVNVRGLLLCMKHEIRAMRRNQPPPKRKKGWRTDPAKGETQERTGYGRIVNVGSAAAFIGFPRAGIYIASKHAVHGLTQTAAIELAADTDIRVNMVVPGSVKTHNYELFTESQDALKRLLIQGHATKQILLPEDCVPAILFLCSDGAFFSVGQPLFIDGGYTAQ